MRIWVTKYALTVGIQEFEAEITGTSSNMIQVPTQQYGPYYHKPFWHTSRKEAMAHAEGMRTRKLATLRKAIAKLESLRFT